MAKHTYTATCTDGKIETRTTDRVYTHVLVAQYGNGYRHVEWCGRMDLAQKAHKKYDKPGIDVALTIVPVDNPRNEAQPEVAKAAPVDQPADIDQGGDFEGFIEAVQAEPTPAQESAGQLDDATVEDIRVRNMTDNGKWYTEPTPAQESANIETHPLYARYAQARERAMYNWGHMPLTFEEFCDAYDPDPIYPTKTDKTERKAQLQAHIERLKRELESYEYELSQLSDGDFEPSRDKIKALRWLSGQGQGASFNKWSYCMGTMKVLLAFGSVENFLRHGFIETSIHTYNDIVVYHITDAGREYLKTQDK